jgi:hypothetical protein
VLEGVSVNCEQVRLAVGRVTVFARKDGLEHGSATLVVVGYDRATATTLHQLFCRRLHGSVDSDGYSYDLKSRVTRRIRKAGTHEKPKAKPGVRCSNFSGGGGVMGQAPS